MMAFSKQNACTFLELWEESEKQQLLVYMQQGLVYRQQQLV
jgi:hypothetical protein